ncbi:MAG TPA: tetratricopeptide repeat protein, partial [Planctomycetota bacterium]|nr:tetratricopeptide repeat protein [Planctomycetota bacterium]
QLLGSPTAVSTIAVPLEELIESIADRQRGLRELKELFPSFSEVLVKTEEGLAASQSPFTPAGLGKLLQLADGLRDIKAIIACSGLFEYFALRCLGDALEREFLKKTVLPELHGLDPETIGFEAAREALPIYRNAIKHAMDPVQVRQSIARLHEKLGEEESAIVQYNFIGDAYYRMGQPARAIEVYQRILELRPQDEMATQKIVRVYQDSAEAELARGNPEGAVKLHESAFTLCPDDETTLRRLTRILIDNGWEADLPELCERAIGHAKRTGDMEVAVRVCRTVLDICPNEATIQKKLVNAYLAFDRLELAAEAMADLARLLNARGQRARALDLAEKIRRLRVDNPEVQKVWRGLARELGMEDAGSRLGLTSTIFAIVLLAFTGYQVWTYYEWKDLEGEALAYAEAARASVQNGDPSSVSLEPDPRTAMLRGLA